MDWAEGDCGGSPQIITGGYSSAHSLHVSRPAGCMAWTGWAATPYRNKLCVYKGYYKSNISLNVGMYAMASGQETPAGGERLSATSEWAQFQVYFDMRNLQETPSSVEARFLAEGEGVFELYIDGIEVCALY